MMTIWSLPTAFVSNSHGENQLQTRAQPALDEATGRIEMRLLFYTDGVPAVGHPPSICPASLRFDKIGELLSIPSLSGLTLQARIQVILRTLVLTNRCGFGIDFNSVLPLLLYRYEKKLESSELIMGCRQRARRTSPSVSKITTSVSLSKYFSLLARWMRGGEEGENQRDRRRFLNRGSLRRTVKSESPAI